MTCLEIEGFNCIARSVSNTRYPIALTRREKSGGELGDVPVQHVLTTY